jgi:hypothetical protein
MVNNELERMWQQAIVAQFKVLSRNFSGRTGENHETLANIGRYPVRFEPETSRIHVRRVSSRTKLHGDDPLTVKCDYEFCMACYGGQSDVEVGLFKSCLASL